MVNQNNRSGSETNQFIITTSTLSKVIKKYFEASYGYKNVFIFVVKGFIARFILKVNFDYFHIYNLNLNLTQKLNFF